MVSVAAAVAILEVGARQVFSVRPEPEGFWMPHSEYLFAHRPGARGYQHNGDRDETIPIAISNRGLRDRNFGPKRANEYRTLILGDSFTFGIGERPEDTVARQLEAMLNETSNGKTHTVINGGVSGYGPWQEHGLLRTVGFDLLPDLVILQVLPANDIDNTLAQSADTLESYGAGTERTVRLFAYRNTARYRMEVWLQSHSAAYYGLVSSTAHSGYVIAMLNGLPFVPRLADPERLRLPPNTDRPPGMESNLREWYPTLQKGWRMFEQDVSAIARDCRERGIRFLAYCQPSMSTVSDAHWERVNEMVPEDLYERGKEVRLTHALFERNDIPYVDVAAELRAAEDIPALYHRYDQHLSARGNGVVARLIFEHLDAERRAGGEPDTRN